MEVQEDRYGFKAYEELTARVTQIEQTLAVQQEKAAQADSDAQYYERKLLEAAKQYGRLRVGGFYMDEDGHRVSMYDVETFARNFMDTMLRAAEDSARLAIP